MLSTRLVSLVYIFACLVAAIDPYEVLGIPRDADERTIKAQYRQMSKQYHPDKNPDPEAHDRFIEVGEAYGILNDPQKKANFDKYGDPDGKPQHGGMNDMFNQFFQGGFGQRQKGPPRGGDTQVSVQVPLKDFYLGKDVEFAVEMSNICDKCTGSGSADGKRHKCSRCDGSGVYTQTVQFGPMIQRMQSPCDQCQGSGTTIANKCKTCGGGGTAKKRRQYHVYVAPGTPKNDIEVLVGEGDQSPAWEAGNLNVKIVEHPRDNWGFRRVGDNLYRTEVLTAKEAGLGGWKREIRLFDDELVVLARDQGISVIDGQVDTVVGHGMPLASDHDEYGHLYVEYRVLPVGKTGTVKDEL